MKKNKEDQGQSPEDAITAIANEMETSENGSGGAPSGNEGGSTLGSNGGSQEDSSPTDGGSKEDDPFADNPMSKGGDDSTPEKDGEDGEGGDVDDFDKETEQKLEEMKNDPHQGIKYKELRMDLKEARAENARLKQEGVNSEEMEALKAENELLKSNAEEFDKLKKDQAFLDYKKTPEYESNISAPFRTIEATLRSLAESNEIDAEQLIKELDTPNRADQNAVLDKYAGDMNERDRYTLTRVCDDITVTYGREQAMKEEATDRLKDYEERQVSDQAVRHQQLKMEYGKSVEDTYKTYASKISVLVDNDGTESDLYNNSLEKAKSFDWNSESDDTKAWAAMAGAILPDLVKNNSTLAHEVTQLKAQLSRYKSSTPKPMGRKP